MSYVLELQKFGDGPDEGARTIGSTISIALCGSTISAFWC
ncbi:MULTISPECIES: class III lanthipeptide [Cellulomonas]|nr:MULTISPECIES: class III lanthipeptide [Cellulomonas]UCN15259.1 class III lanthipeptide [Cellulomonas iranensis]